MGWIKKGRAVFFDPSDLMRYIHWTPSTPASGNSTTPLLFSAFFLALLLSAVCAERKPMQLETLGRRIRTQRERLGLKQNDIANALQVSPQAVSKWERGENGPDITALAPLAKLLGVSTDWLLDAHRENRDVFEATVFVSTVIGAYEKSLHTQAREFAVWANGLLFQLTEAVLRYDGVPIKYMGDAFLCFFSGTDHPMRAAQAAALSQRIHSENLVISLCRGEIYLGAMGHPDYAHPDIAGETVNIAFLTRNWAETNLKAGIVATAGVVSCLDDGFEILKTTAVNFHGIENPIRISAIRENPSKVTGQASGVGKAKA